MNTTYFMNLIAGNIFKTKTSPGIPNYYIGLSTTAPNISGGNVNEPGGNGYARVQLTSLSTPNNGVVQNSGDINFPESSASWGTVTNFVIFDAATGGNLLMYGPLFTSRTVEASTAITLRANSLQLSVVDPA